MARYRHLTRYAFRQWRGLALILAAISIGSALSVLQPWPMKMLVDHALGTHVPLPQTKAVLDWLRLKPATTTLVAAAAVASLLIFFLNSMLDVVLSWAWAAVGQGMVYDLAADLFARLQRLSLLFHGRQSVGDSLSRVTGDSWCIFTLTEGLLVAPVQHFMVIICMGIVAYRLDPELALIMLGVTPVLGASAFSFGRGIKRKARKDREASARLMSFVHQALSAVPVVQAFGSERRNRQQFDRMASDSVAIAQQGIFIRSSFTMVNGLATAIGVAIILFLGGRRVLDGALTLGGLLVFMTYVNSIRAASQALLTTYANVRATDASVDRVLEILDASERVHDRPGAVEVEAGPGAGEIRLESVVFGYEEGRPVLKGVSLSASPGQVVALVGPTGAGKSTLVSLVPRFFDVWEGRMTLGGKDVRDLKLASLRAQVSLVLQEPFLLPLSVAENIAYGRPGASRAEVEAAAEAANAKEFIRELPQGYETILGERGASLSGGQRQRLSIARALLKNAPILILDEPTSALDAGTESLVMGALEKLMAGRTVLVIAHRLSTVRRADKIVVLEGGRVVEQGTHKELVAAGGAYARLAALQLTEPTPEVLA